MSYLIVSVILYLMACKIFQDSQEASFSEQSSGRIPDHIPGKQNYHLTKDMILSASFREELDNR